MSVKVRIPTQLRSLTGGAREIQGAGTTLTEIISSIDATHPGVAERLLDDDGTLRRFVNIYLDGEDIRYLQGLETEVSQDSQVTIIPSVAGGSRSRNVTDRLDAVVAHRSLLEHPFYRAWVAGTLERRHLSLYAAQYWRQVEAFPIYLEALIPRVPLHSRRVLADNLHDELDGDHAGLWRRFAAAVGETGLEFAPLWPETRECLDAFKQGIDHAPVSFALGMIYGYESQTPAVAQAKLASLQDRYGVGLHDAEYFSLHATLDVEHASQLADAICDIAGDDEGALETAEAGAWAGAVAIGELLDGVWARCCV